MAARATDDAIDDGIETNDGADGTIEPGRRAPIGTRVRIGTLGGDSQSGEPIESAVRENQGRTGQGSTGAIRGIKRPKTNQQAAKAGADMIVGITRITGAYALRPGRCAAS
jgi:hypothetical protein